MRALDQDRVGDHRVEDLVVGDAGAVEPELIDQRFLPPEPLARGDSARS